MGRFALFSILLLLVLSTGCVQRTMFITSDPPGALVIMNDQEIGRTPVQRDFTWYGTYDVQVRKDGYETLEEKTKIAAPVWQWPPIDLFAELCPWHPKDERHLSYTLKPASTQPINPAAILARAGELQSKLESSKYTHAPTPPATQPTTRSSP